MPREQSVQVKLCGKVGVNHHTLSDFRVGHGEALDEMFTQVLVSLVEQKLIRIISDQPEG